VGPREESGAATAEHTGLTVLVAALLLAAIAALASAPAQSGRDVGAALARKLRCGAAGPGPCWRDPLTVAYGRPVAGAVRALAPAPATRAGLLPVDFRRCRSASCALPGARDGVTASKRRVTAFVSVADHRPTGGPAEITYWLYRPTLGWESIVRRASSADIERLAATPLLETAVPVLVALETLDGRNQYEFAPGEEPPWRWRVEPAIPPV
jgi:Flp pilus assembly pilin Flp